MDCEISLTDYILQVVCIFIRWILLKATQLVVRQDWTYTVTTGSGSKLNPFKSQHTAVSAVGLPSGYPAILDVVSAFFFQLVCSNMHTSEQFMHTGKFLKSCTSSHELCFNIKAKPSLRVPARIREVCVIFLFQSMEFMFPSLHTYA
jgi:hypothetical protein